MPKIITPNPAYSGQIGTATFVNGQATTDDPAVLAYARRRGYTVEPDEAAPEPAPAKQRRKTTRKKPADEHPGGLDESAPRSEE